MASGSTIATVSAQTLAEAAHGGGVRFPRQVIALLTEAIHERKRCVEAVRFASRLVREFIENALGEQLTWSSQGVIDLFEWARGEIEEPQRPGE